ncbi:MAG TPA: DUF4988 domain-containing protein [Candidatus Coprenecus stercoravium]|uniref:DUF4988 domain-containing protein n=1 Tax=Candidatus Coprenecus stercoravium TaxID=2840735 RepID=A0A9D2KAC1_9BACT|nr:DUF4988 domain-containing protein [Candidatus Coprenecus stercoravium]
MKPIISIFSALLATTLLVGACSQFDDTDLKNSISEITDRVDSLEARTSTVQSDITALQTILNQIEAEVTVDAVSRTEEGCVIQFSDGKTVTIRDGVKGADGKPAPDGTPAARITVIEDNGNYFWGYIDENGESQYFLNDNDERIPTSAIIPTVRINDKGEWEMSVDGGANWTSLGVNAMGDSPVFYNLYEDESNVYIILTSGAKLTIPKTPDLTFEFQLDGQAVTEAYFTAGEAKSFDFKCPMYESAEITFTKPYGWKVSITDNSLTITAPVAENTAAAQSGTVTALVSAGNSTAVSSIDVKIGTAPETPEATE